MYISILNPILLTRFLKRLYLSAAYSSGTLVEVMKRTGLNFLFLHKPGEIVSDAHLLSVFEQMVGCYAVDHELNVHPLLEMLTRLLTLFKIPDFDSNFTLDFFGTQRAVHYLDGFDLYFGDQLGTATLYVTTPPDPLKPCRTTTIFYNVPLCEGYGHDEDSSHAANLEALQKSPALHQYCRDLVWFQSSQISSLIRSERVLVNDFDAETYLQ